MTQIQAHRNLRLLAWFNVLRFAAFWQPVEQLYLYAIGADEWVLALGVAMWTIAQVLFEMPSGFVADRWGRKTSFYIGQSARFIGFGLILVGNSVAFYLAGVFCIGMSVAFNSGTDYALLYETLHVIKRKHRYKKYAGRLKSMRILGVVVGALLAVPISLVSYKLNLGLSMVPQVAAMLLVYFMFEPAYKKTSESLLLFVALKSIACLVLQNKSLWLWMLLSSMLMTVKVLNMNFGQAFILDATDVALLVTIAWVGGALARLTSNELAQFYSGGPWPLVFFTLVVMVLMAFSHGYLAIALYMCLFLPINVATIANEEAMQAIARDDLRATSLSAIAFFNRLVMLLPVLVVGGLMTNIGPQVTMQWVSVLFLCIALGMFAIGARRNLKQ